MVRLVPALLVLALAAPAAAQMAEVSLDRGPAAELYLRKRPATPEAPVLAPELRKLLRATETKRSPTSPLYGDAWMMIGEHHFAALEWAKARAAYANILANKSAATYDLALFKTAWCDWKLGDVDTAARRFKEVLDLAVEAERA